jgi:hypothetical protein
MGQDVGITVRPTREIVTRVIRRCAAAMVTAKCLHTLVSFRLGPKAR